MPRIIASRIAYLGYAKVSVVTLADNDGQTHEREVIGFGQSACVLPYDPARRMALLVRLPRAPLMLEGAGVEMTEAPAGMLGAGEDPESAARREAMEEAGVMLGALDPVATCWPSPGVVSERTHLFLASYGAGDRKGPGGGLADEHEAITVVEIPLDVLWRTASAGQVRDLKTLALVFALRSRRPDIFSED